MQYISTRGSETRFSSALAIRQGIAPDGGLLVPESFPQLSLEEITAMAGLNYIERAVRILALYLTDYTTAELREFAESAYSEDKFGTDPAPLVQLNKYNELEFMLELWHGPTAAFKDMALQILPHLMTAAIDKTTEPHSVCILTATSGDTGKAALEGFRDVPGTSVIVFYPSKGVSDAQRLQMVTQEGDNCTVIAVDGNFDDAQNGVKRIFSDETLKLLLQEHGVFLSSANSINWGRLAPQIVYYFSAYADLIARAKIEPGELINFVVPTGNFGNILAGYYARRMGLPINKLVCASNSNRVLSDFARDGNYRSKREFFQTNSPSMDILVSSNLERLLFELCDRDSARIREWMNALSETGNYMIDKGSLRQLQEVIVGGFADDQGTLKTIRELYDRCDHLIDTHTAVGFNVYSRYASRSGDSSKTVFISTASPFKFGAAVSDALNGMGYSKGRSESTLLTLLAEESGLEIPPTLVDLYKKPIRHSQIIRKENMRDAVVSILLKNDAAIVPE
jgi:threonine synthase